MAAPTYPLMMPTTGVRSTSFELVEIDAVNELVSGATPATQIAPPYWDISITTANLQRRTSRYRLWRSFLDSLRGQKKIGLFYDADAPRPANYIGGIVGMTKAGGGSFDGTGDVDTVTNIRQVTISGLPASFVLLNSDYIEFRKGGRSSLHRLISDSTANGSGVVAIYFEPALSQYFDATSTFNLEKPCCEGFKVGKVDDQRDLEGGAISFSVRSRYVA